MVSREDSDLPAKRRGPAKSPESKKSKREEGGFVESDDEEVDSKCTPTEVVGNKKL